MSILIITTITNVIKTKIYIIIFFKMTEYRLKGATIFYNHFSKINLINYSAILVELLYFYSFIKNRENPYIKNFKNLINKLCLLLLNTRDTF